MTEDRSHDRPQGPVDPHGEGGQDAPAPPGGPQRTDSAPPNAPTPGHGASGDEQSDPPADGRQQEDERVRQQQNAGTSQDEPSQ